MTRPCTKRARKTQAQPWRRGNTFAPAKPPSSTDELLDSLLQQPGGEDVFKQAQELSRSGRLKDELAESSGRMVYAVIKPGPHIPFDMSEAKMTNRG